MSEPVSNAEIEDVLSSIRRLVSENSGSNRSHADASQTPEKLVLTPALRVLDTADSAQETPPEAPEPDPPEAKTGDAEPDRESAESDSVAPLSQAPESDLEVRIAELECAIDETFEEWEPDGSEEEVQAPDPAILNHGGENQPEIVSEAENFQPEDAFVDATDWDDSATVEAKAVTDEADANITDGLDDGAAFLDEDSLREMVSQLVREELQGHVGERITRNVRRLVRREIKRALSIRDLE